MSWLMDDKNSILTEYFAEEMALKHSQRSQVEEMQQKMLIGWRSFKSQAFLYLNEIIEIAF